MGEVGARETTEQVRDALAAKARRWNSASGVGVPPAALLALPPERWPRWVATEMVRGLDPAHLVAAAAISPAFADAVAARLDLSGRGGRNPRAPSAGRP